jgi:tetratricopeptide (TPR) repeat protein
MRRLNKTLKYNGKEVPVLVFTGIGGMGKTALRIAFENQILKPKKIPYAVLDYDGDPNLRPIEATLRTMRRQLGRYKVKTPVFDYLCARYFELSSGIKLSAKNYPPELEGVVNILEGIPFVGNVTQILHGLSQLGLSAKERVQHKEWLYRIRELEPREVLNLLPEVLAEDLEEAMSSQAVQILKSSQSRIVLLLDAYERLSESQIDDTLHRKFLFLTPHLLRIIFTRDPLPWEHKFPKEWQGKITHFPSLEVLSWDDAEILLRKKNVDNPDLQRHLYQLTGGYPFHLELCADICREIEEGTGKEPEIQDFQVAAEAKDLTEGLVTRLLRQLKDNERDLMGLACYPRWVCEDVLEVLSSVPESVLRIFKKFKRLSMFSSHPEISDAYVIRKEVRECLLVQERQKRLWKKHHGKLSTFHKKGWEETQKFYHLQEAVYHSFYENLEQAIKLFEEHFWKLLEKFNFGQAEGLLEAVPIETLSEESKRKVDYARARLLTATVHSHQSLITAKKIFESLVVSETDEAILDQYLFSLGDLMCDTSEYEEALKYFQKALAIRQKVYGEENPEVASVYDKIGEIHEWQGINEKALGYFQKSLAIRQKVYGQEHPNVAMSYVNIGNQKLGHIF